MAAREWLPGKGRRRRREAGAATPGPGDALMPDKF